MTSTPQTWILELVQKMDKAVVADGDATRCQQVMEALSESIGEGSCVLDPALLRPVDSGYGRRLLHHDPAGAYSIVLMIWDSGQGTPLHDHSGMWCVEGVCQGRITVSNYDRLPNLDSGCDLFDFELKEVMEAGVGEAGRLIPPFDYHTIHNGGSELAATIHVYGGEVLKCNTFLPQEGGGYQLEVRQLCYND